MNNLAGFLKYLKHKKIALVVVGDGIGLSEGSAEPSNADLQAIKSNKQSLIEYLKLDVDRSKPCSSSLSGCVYSLPVIGCINSKYKNLRDKYLEDCQTCKGFQVMK